MDVRAHRLSDLLRATVVDPTGRRLGRVADLTLRLGDGDAVVDRVLIADRNGSTRAVPWEAVEAVESGRLVIDGAAMPLDLTLAGAASTDAERLESDELLLGRDVLDTQIVDLDGKRLVRVGDVVLAEGPAGTLTAIVADTGFGAVLRRLGLLRLGDRLGEEAVAWDALHLTSARGHTVQLATPAATVHRLSAAEVGLLLDAVTTQAGVDIVQTVHPDVAAAALAASHPHTARRLARAMRHPGSRPARRTRRHDGWRRRVPARRGHR